TADDAASAPTPEMVTPPVMGAANPTEGVTEVYSSESARARAARQPRAQLRAAHPQFQSQRRAPRLPPQRRPRGGALAGPGRPASAPLPRPPSVGRPDQAQRPRRGVAHVRRSARLATVDAENPGDAGAAAHLVAARIDRAGQVGARPAGVRGAP